MKKPKSTPTRSERVSRVVYIITLFSFVAALIYVPLRATLDVNYREGTELHLIIFQTVFGLFAVNLPIILTRRFNMIIPGIFSTAYTLFLFASIFLGEVLMFYYRVPFFDDVLHLSSSMMLGLFGFSAVEMLCGKRKSEIGMPPFFSALFSAAFAISIGVLWEIYEFTFDGLLGLNMQKFAVECGGGGEALTNLVGRAALADTMTDVIVDTVGAVTIAVIGYISLKRKGRLINAFKVRISKHVGAEEQTNQNPSDTI